MTAFYTSLKNVLDQHKKHFHNTSREAAKIKMTGKIHYKKCNIMLPE